MNEATFNVWDTNLFCGLYESVLHNSDTEYNLSQELNDGQACNVDYDWDEYKEVAGKSCVDSILNELYNHDIIDDINYESVISPRYYNYDTDRVVINVHYNFISLVKYCRHIRADKFKQLILNSNLLNDIKKKGRSNEYN